ncbi:MAG: sulfatase [Deltaproteobacteria bacterium]|nr:MAG: sulfatase [Deltaproteobacteria bacterium]
MNYRQNIFRFIIRGIIISFIILTGGFLLFYFLLAYPNDHRVKRHLIHFEPAVEQEEITFNLIDQLDQAIYTSNDFSTSLNALENYPYINNSRAYHRFRENIHISLGWVPLKATHKNAIYAPAPTTIEYRLQLPDSPILEFSYAILSSIKGVIQAPARFLIRVVDQEGDAHLLFDEQESPMKPYRWKHRDPLNKQLLQYLNVNLEDRNGRWRDGQVDLQKFAGQEVILQLLTRVPEDTEDEDRKQAHALWGNPIIYNRKQATSSSLPYNLIIILVDALRADHLGINGQEGNLTPNIDNLAREGVNFSHALANGNMTMISVPMILTSRYCFEIPNACRYFAGKVNKEEFYRKKIPNIASILKDNGYVTRAAGTLMSLSGGMGFNVDFGFDDLVILEREGYNTVHLTYDTLQWLERNANKNFFLLLYYNAPHGGDKAPLRYLPRAFRWDLNPRDFLRFTYRAEVAYSDDYVGEVLDALDELRLSDKTMVVLISDHGETMKEFILPNWKDDHKKSIIYHNHGISLSDDELNVPLIMRLPGVIPPGLKIDRTISLVDLLPTIIEGIGITTSYSFQGRSLFPFIRGEQVGAEPIIYARGLNSKSIRLNDRYKYIRYTQEPEKLPPHVTGREELYDLKKDPRGNQNLAVQQPGIVAQSREIMDQVESTQHQTLISFSNLNDRVVEGNIHIDGKIERASLEKEGDIIDSEGSTVNFRISSGNNTLQLQTKPDDAPLRLQIGLNGRSILLEEILVSEYGLPLLTNSEVLIKKEDLKYIRGIYKPGPDDKEPAIYLGRVPLGSSWKLIPERKLLPHDLKVMMEDWGYIQD